MSRSFHKLSKMNVMLPSVNKTPKKHSFVHFGGSLGVPWGLKETTLLMFTIRSLLIPTGLNREFDRAGKNIR